jgi:hypothetical protein
MPRIKEAAAEFLASKRVAVTGVSGSLRPDSNRRGGGVVSPGLFGRIRIVGGGVGQAGGASCCGS